MNYDYGSARFDEAIWDLCEALSSIADVDIVGSDKGFSDQAEGCFSICLAAWSLDAINFLSTVIGGDGTRLCLCVSPWEDGTGHKIDDPYTLLDLIGGPSPTASEVAQSIREAYTDLHQ